MLVIISFINNNVEYSKIKRYNSTSLCPVVIGSDEIIKMFCYCYSHFTLIFFLFIIYAQGQGKNDLKTADKIRS